MSEPTITSILSAASWACLHLGNDGDMRNTAAVAGRVQGLIGVTEVEAMAAWLYRACERTGIGLEEYHRRVREVQIRASADVSSLVAELAMRPDNNMQQAKQAFLKSSRSAKRIRVCEVTFGLAQSAILLLHGSVGCLDSIEVQVDFAKFVYEGTGDLDDDTRAEIYSLLRTIDLLWRAVRATSDGFYNKVAPPTMIPVRILAVVNEQEKVLLSSLPVDATPECYRVEFEEMRNTVGGTVATESVLEATLPLPKWGTATITGSGTDVPGLAS